jgi:hypothetical protein
VNSEELEQSLRAEFENYLKTVVAETRQEISQLQKKVEGEIEKHKAQLDQVFQEAFARVNAEIELDAGFRESVVEHLRLARDEGARITATAIAEAEEMEKQAAAQAAPRAGFAELRAAISEISSKTSQSEILKSLVNHAAEFAPRGAFFIVKNEHFVGWRKFGKEQGENEEAVREVYLSVDSDSILSESVRSLATVESSAETYSADAAILEKLEFGAPEKMYAIPLVARGRGVAVLYADYGDGSSNGDGAQLDTDALETMVRVAGLTVELLASAKAAPKKRAAAAASTTPSFVRGEESHEQETAREESSYDQQPQPAAQGYQPPVSTETYSQPAVSFDRAEGSYQPSYQEPETAPGAAQNYGESYFAREESTVESFQTPAAPSSYPTYDDSAWNQPPAQSEQQPQYEESRYSSQDYSTSAPEINADDYSSTASPQEFSFRSNVEETPSAPISNEYQFDSASSSYEVSQTETFESYPPSPPAAAAETESFDYTQRESSYNPFETPSVAESGSAAYSDSSEQFISPPPVQPVQQQQSAPPARSRFSDRNVDLPIEVTEDERRLHNDARRFARLLVSEIKLYNEQKVKEGREANDLYERLREAIDRSREMYDKRVQPSVAAKFDYFHYELVNSLGEGDVSRLGSSYPGANV